MALDGSTCSKFLLVVNGDFEPLEHVPRTSAIANTCAAVFGRGPCVLRSREHEKRPAVKEKKKSTCIKTHLILIHSKASVATLWAATINKLSHPTAGVRQIFLSSRREELNIAPGTRLRRNSCAQPDLKATFLCASAKAILCYYCI